MKKILIVLMLCLVNIMSFGQDIFTKKIVYDKWYDVIFNKDVKTIMTVTDSTFVFETKGEKPIIYIKLAYFIGDLVYSGDSIDTLSTVSHLGTEDKPIELSPNNYGYQDVYLVVEENDVRQNGDNARLMYIVLRVETDKYGLRKKDYIVVILNSRQEKTVYCKEL